MKKLLFTFPLAFVILHLALFGGMQFYLRQPGVLEIWAVLGWFIIGWGLWVIVTHRWVTDLWLYLLLPLAAVGISMVHNYEVASASFGRLWLYLVALGALLFANVTYKPQQLFDGLWWAGLIWPVVWLVATIWGWQDNQNVVVFWTFLFIVVALHNRSWLYLLPHLVMIFYLGSRGALIGAVISTGVSMYLAWGRPKLRTGYVTVYSGSAIVALWALVMWRYPQAMARLSYWQDAWLAVLHNPAVGVGPGGLKARELIQEVNSPLYVVHAHNFLITWLAETGLVGIIYLGVAAWRVYVNRAAYQIERWQLSFLAGLLAWSLVDEPLWWPGPLVITALVVGTIQRKQKGTDDESNDHLTT